MLNNNKIISIEGTFFGTPCISIYVLGPAIKRPCDYFKTVILRTRVEYELIAIAHIRRE